VAPLLVATYAKRYPLFVPLATFESSRHAALAEGTAGGVQFAATPPSLKDGKFAEYPTVYIEL
jgi:hypothetical protein